MAEREGFEPFFYREDKLLRNTELIDNCYFSYRKTKAVNCRKVKPKHCNLATLWQPLVGISDSGASHYSRSVDGSCGAIVSGDIAPEEVEGTVEIWASLAFPASVKRYR